MPPMATRKSAAGIVTEELLEYYRSRAENNQFGLIITEHSCISEGGRADKDQLAITEDAQIPALRRLTDAIHSGGSLTFAQLNHSGSAANPGAICDHVSASNVNIPAKKLLPGPRPLTVDEIREIELLFTAAAVRAISAGYDGVEIHCAHGYLLDEFYSPLTNRRSDEYGPQNMENRTRFLRETLKLVKEAVNVPVAVRLGGADYLPGGATEEDAVEACRLLEKEGADLLDLSGGMCFYTRPGHSEAGYFGTMTEKIKKAVSVPVLLTGGVNTEAEAEELLRSGKADLIGIGRAVFKDADWRNSSR
jgi:2,4-dienoyl-CoA reductase-like NADH-dependent reductase (Old Yellow Enzyme family)